jgi:hypothetical protein
MNAVSANTSWLTPERLQLARESAAWNEDQGRPGTAVTINVLVAEVENLREAAKGSLVIVNQALADKNLATLKASTLLIAAEKIAACDLEALAGALRTAKHWMVCDPEFDDPEQFETDAALVDAALANSQPLQALSDELHAALKLVRA